MKQTYCYRKIYFIKSWSLNPDHINASALHRPSKPMLIENDEKAKIFAQILADYLYHVVELYDNKRKLIAAFNPSE